MIAYGKRFRKTFSSGNSVSSIREVARLASVSPTTVSRVLNGKGSGHVAAATRQRVVEAAETLEYRPSAAARALVGGRTQTVGIHSCRVLYTSFFMHLVQLTQEIVQKYGLHLLLVPGSDERDLPDLLRERRVDALIWARYPVERADELVEAIAAPHQVVIGIGSIDRRCPVRASAAYWDHRDGISLGVEHLAGLGHERMAYLPGAEIGRKLWPDMVEAFEAATAELGVVGEVLTAKSEVDNFAAGMEVASRALELQPTPTALITRNDDIAIGALHGLAQAGVSVPGGMSVVGYNDLPIATYCTPPLTTIHIPYAEAVTAVLPAVLERLAEGSVGEQGERICSGFKTRLVVRGTTGPPSVA